MFDHVAIENEHVHALGNLRRCRVIDHHVEIRPAFDGKGGNLKLDRPDPGMLQALHSVSVTQNLVVAPQCFELGAHSGKFLDELLNLRARARTRGVGPEGADHESRDAQPLVLGRLHAQIGKQQAQDVALRPGSWE